MRIRVGIVMATIPAVKLETLQEWDETSEIYLDLGHVGSKIGWTNIYYIHGCWA